MARMGRCLLYGMGHHHGTERSIRRARAAVLALLVVCAGTPWTASGFQQLPAGVTVITRTEYYELHGRTVAELAADLRRLGPRDAEGRVQAGAASSPLRWQYAKRSRGLDCHAVDVRVTVNTDILLPRWVPPADTEPGLLAKWNASLAALAVHERGHQEISVRYATLIRNGISRLRTTCRGFDAQADSASNRLITTMRGAQQAYDAETRHGLAQGTGFPPRPAP